MMFQQDAAARDTARLEDYLRAVRMHRFLVLAAILSGTLLAFLFANSRVDTYEAEAKVVLNPTPVGSINVNLVTPNLDREREVLESSQTAAGAAELLNFDGDPDDLLEGVRVVFRDKSDVLGVTVTNTKAAVAAERANAFADTYVATREGEAVDYYTSIRDAANEEIAALEKSLAELDADAAQLDLDRAAIFRDFAAGETRDDAVRVIDEERSNNRTESATARNQVTALTTVARDASAKLASRTPTAAVIRRATAPDQPLGLSRSIILLAGALLGLAAGIITAFIVERLDTTARDDDDIALALGTKVIGGIPTLGYGQRSGPATLVMASTNNTGRIAAAKEGFRRLRSAVQFIERTDGLKSVIVTSASPAEGKSLTAANLAIAVAQGGRRVVLVSADMRRPTQEARFGIAAGSKGLSNFRGGDEELTAIEIATVPNLWVMPAGAPPANPGELLGSTRFGHLIEQLVADVDLVIVDTPPVLSTADATAAAHFVDGVIVVVDTRRTDTHDLLQIRADLERSGSKLIGAVMNRKRIKINRLFRKDRYTYYAAPTE
ncbi:MAG: polysaccharide biosynthesis tyrosine autokinase [Acidimicrobiales bacterium]